MSGRGVDAVFDCLEQCFSVGGFIDGVSVVLCFARCVERFVYCTKGEVLWSSVFLPFSFLSTGRSFNVMKSFRPPRC